MMGRLDSYGRRGRGDEGMTLIWVAIAFVVILMFAALAIDGGQAYQTHRQSQNAADAGAMAGNRVLTGIRFTQYSSTFTNLDIPQAVRQEALASGANNASNGIECYLISFPDSSGNTTRVSTDMCANNTATAPTNAEVNVAYGVEVKARRTVGTFFARSIGSPSVAAQSAARAVSKALADNVKSPFIVCGVQDASHSGDLSWAYNMLDPTDHHVLGTSSSDTTSALVFKQGVNPGSWQNKPKYYALQNSHVPQCGNESSTFKGKADGSVPGGQSIGIGDNAGIENGNGFNSNIAVSVAGIKACTPAQLTNQSFDGCAMILPIADYGGGNGNSVYGPDGQAVTSGSSSWMHITAFAAFMVWGTGNTSKAQYKAYGSAVQGDPGYDTNPNGANADPDGASCTQPIKAPAGDATPGYCGRLLGTATVTGGKLNGPPTMGAPSFPVLI